MVLWSNVSIFCILWGLPGQLGVSRLVQLLMWLIQFGKFSKSYLAWRRDGMEGCLFHIRVRSKLNVYGWFEVSDIFWRDGKKCKWQTKIDKQSRKTAVSIGHLMSVPWVCRIPLMLKAILKSVGSRVDKLWTHTEYQSLHPEQNIREQLIYIDLSNWRPEV